MPPVQLTKIMPPHRLSDIAIALPSPVLHSLPGLTPPQFQTVAAHLQRILQTTDSRGPRNAANGVRRRARHFAGPLCRLPGLQSPELLALLRASAVPAAH